VVRPAPVGLDPGYAQALVALINNSQSNVRISQFVWYAVYLIILEQAVGGHCERYTGRQSTSIMVPILIVAAVLYFAVLAQAKPTNIIFVPPQPPPEFSSQFPNGVTGRCTDTTDPIDASTCSVLQLGGPPERLVCDIPVVLEITQNDPPFSLSAFRCRTTE
jgi:hypothetical protein